MDKNAIIWLIVGIAIGILISPFFFGLWGGWSYSMPMMQGLYRWGYMMHY